MPCLALSASIVCRCRPCKLNCPLTRILLRLMQAAMNWLCRALCEMLTSRLCCAGLELFFVDTGGPSTTARTPSVFFAFRSELDRDRAAAAIAQQPSLGSSLPGGRQLASACGSILEVSRGQMKFCALSDIRCLCSCIVQSVHGMQLAVVNPAMQDQPCNCVSRTKSLLLFF